MVVLPAELRPVNQTVTPGRLSGRKAVASSPAATQSTCFPPTAATTMTLDPATRPRPAVRPCKRRSRARRTTLPCKRSPRLHGRPVPHSMQLDVPSLTLTYNFPRAIKASLSAGRQPSELHHPRVDRRILRQPAERHWHYHHDNSR